MILCAASWLYTSSKLDEKPKTDALTWEVVILNSKLTTALGPPGCPVGLTVSTTVCTPYLEHTGVLSHFQPSKAHIEIIWILFFRFLHDSFLYFLNSQMSHMSLYPNFLVLYIKRKKKITLPLETYILQHIFIRSL